MGESVLFVVGTRPDAIKLIPVYYKIRDLGCQAILCSTDQHKDLLLSVLDFFDVTPDVMLDVMIFGQGLDYLTSSIVQKMSVVLKKHNPKIVVVQGDTTTSFATALAAFYLNIPVVHIEAGLRTYNQHDPFPEELNRSFITKLSTWHFAPTPTNVMNLLQDGVDVHSIFCVGNTVIDALRLAENKIDKNITIVSKSIRQMINDAIHNGKKIILFTTHRRESFGKGLSDILDAIRFCLMRYEDIIIIFPVHPNPSVQEAVKKSKILEYKQLIAIDPLSYVDLIFTLRSCSLVITDSGGLQEEAAYLGKALIILRNMTERSELLWMPYHQITGTNTLKIIEAFSLWHSSVAIITKEIYAYGDGYASDRIATILLEKGIIFS